MLIKRVHLGSFTQEPEETKTINYVILMIRQKSKE